MSDASLMEREEPAAEQEELRILCVEDSPEDAELMRELLTDEGFAVTMSVVDTLEAVRAALTDGSYDVVLADYNLPGFNGEATLQVALETAPQTPFVVVSGSIGEETAVDLLKHGADDYVLKDRLSRLPFAIRRALESRRAQAARRQAQEDLRISEERYRLLMDNANDAVYVASLEADGPGPLIDVNKRGCALLGYSREELLALDKAALDERMPYRRAGDLARELLAQGHLVFESEHLAADGSRLPVEVSANLFELQDSQIIMAMVRDISERKQAEETLREISRKDAEALSVAKMAYWDYDVATSTFQFNDRFYRLHGITDAESSEMAVSAFIHEHVIPSFKPQFSDALRHAIETRDADFRMQTDLQLNRSDGEVQWVSTTLFIDKDESGNTVRLHGVNQDITERKQAEEAQRTAEERFAKAFKASPSPMVITRLADGTILNTNDAFLTLLGFSREEALGAKATSLAAMADLDEHPLVLAQLQETGSVRDFETSLRTHDGEQRDVSMSMETIELGGEQCLLSSFFDLTERRRAEEDLQTALHDTVRALGAVATLRDPYTGDHERRVTVLADAIAAEMQLPADRREGLRMAGEVHDVGKIGVPAEILSKPGKLTDVEFRLVAQHAAKGYEILRGIAFRWPVAEIVHQHHERLNGSGYPRGLMGHEMLLEARILAVADVAEAMASHRPYRPALGVENALEELRTNAGPLYDRAAVAICEHVLRAGTVDLSAV